MSLLCHSSGIRAFLHILSHFRSFFVYVSYKFIHETDDCVLNSLLLLTTSTNEKVFVCVYDKRQSFFLPFAWMLIILITHKHQPYLMSMSDTRRDVYREKMTLFPGVRWKNCIENQWSRMSILCITLFDL